MNETLSMYPKQGILTSVGELPTTLLVASAIPILFYILSFLISPSIDPHEPPVVWPRIPMVGHIIGMVRGGFKYYRGPVAYAKAPIVTLPVLNGKMYIATGRDVISQIARHSKTLSFTPFVAPMVMKISGANSRAIEVVVKNLGGEEGDNGYWINITRRMKTLLAPGENLTRMEQSIFSMFSLELRQRAQELNGKPTGLYNLMRHLLNKGTLTTLYGASHPYNLIPSFADDLTKYELGLDRLLIGVWPSLIARSAYLARERIIGHVTEYMKDGLPDDANAVIRARIEEGERFGLTHAEIARFEITLIFAIVENSAPAAFWLLARIYSTPGLVEDLRADLLTALQAIHPNHNPSDPLPFYFLSNLAKTVPLLKSAFEEMLRLHSFGCTARQVLSDTLLEGRERDFLVKQDNVILIPNSVLHSNANSFPDPDIYNPRRFVVEGSKPAELRPWGGGNTICPGRHFATAETLGLAALVILGFDLQCVDAKGKVKGKGEGKGETTRMEWWLPDSYQHSQAAGVFPPREDVDVRLVPREGWNVEVSID